MTLKEAPSCLSQESLDPDVQQAVELLEPHRLGPQYVDRYAVAQTLSLIEAQSQEGLLLPLPELAADLLSRWYYEDLRMGKLPLCVNSSAARLTADALRLQQPVLRSVLSLAKDSPHARFLHSPSVWGLQQLVRQLAGAENLSAADCDAGNNHTCDLPDEKGLEGLCILTPESIRDYVPLLLWLARQEHARTVLGQTPALTQAGLFELPVQYLPSEGLPDCQDPDYWEKLPTAAEQAADEQEADEQAANYGLHSDTLMRTCAQVLPCTRAESVHYLLQAYLMLTEQAPMRPVRFDMDSPSDEYIEALQTTVERSFPYPDSWRLHLTGTPGSWPAPAEKGQPDGVWDVYDREDTEMPDPVPPALSVRLLRYSPALTGPYAGKWERRHQLHCADFSGLLEAFYLQQDYEAVLADYLASHLQPLAADALLPLAESGEHETWRSRALALKEALWEVGLHSLSSAQLYFLLRQSTQLADDDALARVHGYVALSNLFPQELPHRQRALREALALRSPSLAGAELDARVQAHAEVTPVADPGPQAAPAQPTVPVQPPPSGFAPRS